LKTDVPLLKVIPCYIVVAVNTAKRIESLTRDFPNTILTSESINKKTKELFPTRLWGEVSLKGKEEKILVYQLI